MDCSGGICAPTARNAILNARDLEALLASGNVEVTTTGSGVQAGNIDVDAALAWSSTNILALDAHESLWIEKPVSVTGQGGLSVTTNDGGKDGYFAFGTNGNITFANLSSTLTINGVVYTLVGDIATLAGDIAGNPSGSYALAANYDAAQDGTYATAPITTTFTGSFNGLGNTISHMSINDPNYDTVGLFAQMAPDGVISSVRIRSFRISGGVGDAGGLVGLEQGAINNSSATGSITLVSQLNDAGYSLGGLVGATVPPASVIMSSATVKIEGNDYSRGEAIVGGLVGGNEGRIAQSYATGIVSTGIDGLAGGLTGGSGTSSAAITQSYADVSVSGGRDAEIGGLVGENQRPLTESYSIGALKHLRHEHSSVGGLIGIDYAKAGKVKSSYWDISTSHIKGHSHGAGRPRHDPGITGLTTEQFQSGLPNGFSSKVWAEDPNINNGLPYLINNPPEE
jgi:hypothetical protein